MNRRKKWMSGAAVIVLSLGLAACSTEDNQYSPEQVINNAMKETEEPLSYYGEATMNVEEEELHFKEWRTKEGKFKMDMDGATAEERTVTVNDGQKITLYQESLNQALISEDGEMLAAMAPSPKEQAKQLLKVIGDTHTISIDEEEKIAGRTAYHLVAKADEKDTLIGDQELWVDKENWFVLKSISTSGDDKIAIEYTKIEFGKEFPDDTFTIELPEGVEIQNMDEMNQSTEVSIEEAAQHVGQPVLYFKEEDGRKIESIEMDDLTGALDRVEININYVKDDAPLFSLSLFKTPADLDSSDSKMPGEKAVEIRGVEGTTVEMEGFRALFWKEDGLSYSILLNDPEVTFEEVIEWANTMELVE
ncbi:outer membrane lipoprotein carrier protein LolA [Sporosarcina sp. GW1-11]|uniref:LolA family protein n=1 Tax=Sporosarcina sp. GW1-11 TaxID=2899126 RepID=UPI00294CBB25|nr:outer membrane lipoprotein carrier protein LolA [Sporosarcina sp. GW1-11]MDV6377053.1 outer membrane lipoprotein carrier protein LolA [Sporosarcina sp. GW1-11]